MRSLLITLEYPPFYGGVANYYHNLVCHWHSELPVIDSRRNQLLSKWLWPHWLPSFWHAGKFIKDERIEHVLVGQILPLGTVVYYLSKMFPISYSVFIHGMDISFALKRKRKRYITKKILQNASAIICTNNYARDIIEREGLGGEKCIVVFPAADAQPPRNQDLEIALRKKYNLQNKKVVYSLSRLVKRKGIDKVLDAWPVIQNRFPESVYVVSGEGPDEEYLHALAQGKNNIIFTGKVDEKEKWAWYNICDLFIMPSRNIAGDYEGFGIVYLEANLAGKPVIAGKSGGVEDAVADGDSGLLVDPEDKHEISGAVIRLLSEPDYSQKLGRQGRERVIRSFSWPVQINKIYNFIKSKI